MGDALHGADLSRKPAPIGGIELRKALLQSHAPLICAVDRPVDRAHPALGDRLEDAEAAGDQLAIVEAPEPVRHGGIISARAQMVNAQTAASRA